MPQKINPDGLAPMGAYSQAVVVPLGDARLVAVSGQIAADSLGNPLAAGDFAEQTRIVFANLEQVLAASGASLNDVFKVQIFLTDMTKFPAVSAVRNEFLTGIEPVSTVVEISRTVIAGCDIEIEAMAMIRPPKNED